MTCFWAVVHIPEITMTIDFDWKTGVAAKDWSNVAKKGQVDVSHYHYVSLNPLFDLYTISLILSLVLFPCCLWFLGLCFCPHSSRFHLVYCFFFFKIKKDFVFKDLLSCIALQFKKWFSKEGWFRLICVLLCVSGILGYVKIVWGEVVLQCTCLVLCWEYAWF